MKAGQSPANGNQSYRAELEEKRTGILRTLGAKFDIRAAMGRVAEDDQAQISHEEFISLQRNSLDYLQLRLVDEALSRLDAGDFGICQSCSDPIAAKRLRALPWARYCIDCQNTVAEDLDQEWRSARPRVAVTA
jgi:DnaK suppressor protein